MNDKIDSSLMNGKTIGSYVLGRNLGEGTFGKVKLAIHSLTGEKVAVKILEKSKIIDVAAVQRVTRQIHILKQVRHPNIIQLYEIIQTPKQLFLVMQYVSEGELFELIVKKKRIKQAQACQFFRQLISGIQYLHELGIAHRDLKPQNLLIDFNKSLKIVDFGLSNTYKPKQILKTACGSPCYAAPQMIAGKKYIGLNADIWSCGVILFAMLCGYLPFEDPNTPILYKKIMAGDFSLPKFISPHAKHLLLGLLTTDPQRRFKIKDIKAHPWFNNTTEKTVKEIYGIKISQDKIPIDPNILNRMIDYNESIQQTKKCLEHNRHNHSTAIYYLLLKKQLKSGIQSQYDICSNNFNPQHLSRAGKQPDQKVQRSQSTKTNQLQEIQLDRMTAAIAAPPRSNRTISRLSHLRTNDSKKREESFGLKYNLDNLPSVDRTKTAATKKGIHQIIINRDNKKGKDESIQISLYDIDQAPFANKFHQTISNGWRKPLHSFRASVKNAHQKAQTLQQKSNSQRYHSVQVAQRQSSFKDNTIGLMNKTFMGKIPNTYIPRWQNQSERIRSILNTTISGHGKRKNKLNLYP